MLLAIDVGTSAVKAALLDGTEIVGDIAHASFETDFGDGTAEVSTDRIDIAIRLALQQVDTSEVERIGITGLAPAWLAMTATGEPLTPIVTHQDRRSLSEAQRIENAIGRTRHLELAGNRPAPGGISSTVAAWFTEHDDAIDQADVLGHLPTYLGQRLTGSLAIDPSNAGFTGLMDVSTMQWSDELCDAAGVKVAKLPPIIDAADTIGETTPDNPYGLPSGLPVFGGYVDGSGPLLVAGAEVGQLMHSAGSTDVLALCLDRPMPRDGLLCRPLGTGGKWVSAATQAAGGASLAWARKVMYHGAGDTEFAEAVHDALQRSPSARFIPGLAGDRQTVEQPTAGLTELTLATDRLDLLAAILRGLIDDHLARLDRLLEVAKAADITVRRRVVITGGGTLFSNACQQEWPGDECMFEPMKQATLRGLGTLGR